MKKIGLIAFLLILSACASDDTSPPAEDNTPKKADKDLHTENLICPQVAILQPAGEVFDYGREKPAPSELVAKARMKAVQGDCAYRADGIDISFALTLAAARGPRLGSGQTSFPFFVAVVDPAENILSRQAMTSQFQFSSNSKTMQTVTQLHVFIPLATAALQSGPDYRVLIGFKLPRDQIH